MQGYDELQANKDKLSRAGNTVIDLIGNYNNANLKES